MTNKNINTRPGSTILSSPRKNTASGEKPITVITRDCIRTLQPHLQSWKPPSYSVVVDVREIDKIKSNDLMLTKEECDKLQKQHEASNESHAAEVRRRKAAMESYDEKRKKNHQLSDIEQSVKEQNNYLLSKAIRQLEEQEDDIKHMNELMIYAKCAVIRDLQVQEKAMIKKQQKDEEQRLDGMMEADRVSALEQMAQREKKVQDEIKKGALIIRQQIREREEAKVLDEERKDQEVKQLLRNIELKAEQDQKDRVERVNAQKKLMEQVVKANQESIARKKQEKQNALDEDRKIMQYLLEKGERETQLEKEQQAKQAEREKELGRLRSLQQKLADKAAEQDALRAQRAYEAYEREWRRKEKETAENQARQQQELRAEREKQQRARDFAIAVEAHKMKEEFYENLEHQKQKAIELEKEKQEKKAKNLQYFHDLKNLIQEKEDCKRKEKQNFFAEGEQLQRQQQEKNDKLKVIKLRKLKELEDLGVPIQYRKQVERRVFNTRKHLES